MLFSYATVAPRVSVSTSNKAVQSHLVFKRKNMCSLPALHIVSITSNQQDNRGDFNVFYTSQYMLHPLTAYTEFQPIYSENDVINEWLFRLVKPTNLKL